jgi:hypothetical protein
MGYRTLFEGSGINHSNSGLHITPKMFTNGFFMLLLDLTNDLAASEGHISNPDNGHIRIELQFSKALIDSVTCLLYLEFENSVRIDKFKTFSTEF